MLQTDLYALFERLAETEPPPTQISIPTASRRGRTRLHLRRASAIGAPVLAASAVLAIALTGAVPAGLLGSSRLGSSTAAPTDKAAAPPQFNPLVPYASFGWLPAGKPQITGGQSAKDTGITATYPGKTGETFSWTAAIAEQCQLAGVRITCGGGSQEIVTITGSAPDINGRSAYWGYFGTKEESEKQAVLVYQYAAHQAWATVDFQGSNPGKPTLLRIARNIHTAQRVKLRFPIQLTGEPGSWQLSSTSWRETSSGPIGGYLDLHLNKNAPAQFHELDISAAIADREIGMCLPGTREVINGYQVDVGAIVAVNRAQDLCAHDADGLTIRIMASRGLVQGATAVDTFVHMKLLGPDPAHWTRRPLG